ncbi:LacI family transcriptional regulator [Streptomyces sp. NP160]|uniref:LacI family DNA-binding transcriptional regulator n=1 Tax=Streptomyces sp. NP160 TaxID=2586637 RepID=UPI001119569C|nr:LacI family DNA-binding transcriptional regulator [Streptomyces sp. NP160]TNM69465.1 LacI family transcriptional regulator [Streptomyces sp. NP160]
MTSRAAPRRAVARIVDVAALAGVSPGTASKALNGTGQLRSETVERVRRAADQLGFTPDGVGRALSSGRSFTVGLVTTDSFGRFTIPVLQGAEDALGAGDMAVLLCDTRDDALREKHLLRMLASRRVDGIIVMGRRTDPRPPVDLAGAAAGAVPVVYAFQPSARAGDTSVVVDEAGGAADAARHLLDLGRRRVGHVTGWPEHHSARVRAASVADVLGGAAAGEPLFGAWTEQWGRQAVDVLLRRHPDLDAVSCGSDQIARGVCDRLRELGRAVPDDVAVTGVDDWDVMALASRPPLTTVDLRLTEVGRRAAQLLLDAVDGRDVPPLTVLPSQLVLRASTLGS